MRDHAQQLVAMHDHWQPRATPCAIVCDHARALATMRDN
jgi:hypothetical protein